MLVSDQISEQRLSVNGYQAGFVTVGDSFRPIMLILPGYTGLYEDLLEFAEYLKLHYYVIIPDMPGWGKSQDYPSSGTIEDYAVFTKQLLDHLKIKRANILGHCLGALTAVEFTSRFPQSVDQLYLVSIPFLQGTWPKLFFDSLATLSIKAPKKLRPLFFLWRSRLIAIPFDLYVLHFKSWKTSISRIKNMLVTQPQQKEEFVEQNWVSLLHFDFKKLQSLTTKVQFIHGKHDRMIPVSQVHKLQARLPAASLNIIDDAGHLPPMETAQELADLVIRQSIQPH